MITIINSKQTYLMKFLFKASLISVCILSSTINNANAQSKSVEDKVYVWIDAKGVKHYGDASLASPSEFARSKTRNLRLSMPESDIPQLSEKATENTNTDKLTSNWEQGANPDERLAPTRTAACEVAQRNVRVLLDESQPAYVRDSSGNPVALDAQGRADRLAQANKDVSSYCQ